jgi:urea transport system substrate-binding protein
MIERISGKGKARVFPQQERRMSRHPSSIKLGLLHSLQGIMAVSERPLLDAELMAIDEINEAGGVLGCPVEAVVADGGSNPRVFAQEARSLLEGGAVSILGCWTSPERKAVRDVVERADSLLWYPLQYEGAEESEHIVYTGSCLNQQVTPALEWALPHLGPRVFLLGSDSVFPRATNQMVRSLIEHLFVRAEIVGESYVPLEEQDFSGILEEIQRNKPDWILNTLNGESNLFFFRQFHAAGFSAREIPIFSMSVAETELQGLVPEAVGHLAIWPCFHNLDTPENQRFVAAFQRRYGPDRVCSAPLVTAYCQVYLWKQAVEAADSPDPRAVRSHLAGTTFDGPMGEMTLQTNHHLALPARIGRFNEDGRFDILWNSPEPIIPLPWLGVEDTDLLHKSLVQKVMSEYSETLQYRAFLEGEIKEYFHLREVLERETSERHLVEEQLECFFSVTIDLLCIADTKGSFRKLNRAWEITLGYTIEELMAHPFLDLVHPDDHAATQNALADLSDQKQVRGLVNRYRCKDGSYRWIEWNSAAVGHLVYAAAHDITERKQAEEALFHSRQMLAMVLDNIPQRVFWKDRDLRYLGCNKAFLANAGCTSPDAIAGKSDFDLPFTKNAAAYRADDQRVLDTGEPKLYYEEPQIRPDGSVAWLRTSKLPLRDPEGNVFGVLGCYEDITKSKEIERQMRLEGLRLNYLLKMNAMMGEPESALFDFTLNAVIELTESEMGYIYFYNEETRMLTLHAWSRKVMEQCSVVQPQTQCELEKTGLWGEVIRQRKAIVENDCEAPNPLKKGYPEGHVLLKRFLSVPVFDVEKIVAVVGVGNKTAPYTEQDEGQLYLLMQGMWQIVQRKRVEEERERLIGDLQHALAEVKALSGLLPICSSCKKVRDDKGYWTQIERFIEARSDASFSHSICPDCLEKLYPEVAEKMRKKG